MKEFAVYFTSNNARIVKDPDVLSLLKDDPRAVFNPNLIKVAGYPPHHWKLVDGQVEPKSDAEIEQMPAEPVMDNAVAVLKSAEPEIVEAPLEEPTPEALESPIVEGVCTPVATPEEKRVKSPFKPLLLAYIAGIATVLALKLAGIL